MATLLVYASLKLKLSKNPICSICIEEQTQLCDLCAVGFSRHIIYMSRKTDGTDMKF